MPAMSSLDRLWLDVPFADKDEDEAKRLGARWDQAARRLVRPAPRHGRAGPLGTAPAPPGPAAR
jgi:Domain of unknown function (DUF5710)